MDYESLPPALRRKYFSSLERLRLAQDATGTTNRRSPPPSRLSILPPNHLRTISQPSSTETSLQHHPRPEAKLFLNRTLLRKRRYRSNLHINSSAAAWFASLSPAAQRKLFSQEECELYGQRNHSVILDAADETLRRRSWYPTLFSSDHRRISDDPTIVDSEASFGYDCEENVDSAIDMGDYSLDGFRWLDDETHIDLRLDDYHEAIAQTARRTASFSDVRIPAKRKTSLSSLSIRRGRSSTSSSRPPPTAPAHDPPATPALPSSKAISRSPSFSLKHIRSQASISSIDPRATHYQDPAARLKLRLYLASPQKFDEAVEFGFPSVQGDHQRVLARPMTSPHPHKDTNRTFFHDDTPELSGDEGDDEGDEPDTLYDPRTPEDPVFQMHRTVQKNSMEGNGSLRPFSLRRKTESYARGSAIDREMTLHMTLTRPDLRAPDDIPPVPPLVNTKINQIPLERPQLNLDGNPLSIWDTLPTEESKMKRFFRKFKLK
ncbi:hypothetical protein LTR84_009463 [Exophiala bonariae]|uniref:Mucin n=1 Tax=Exophiala bonariae TaxID=1690606 RepID=A0AAV9MU52_9EURO|nr:hypothetical protein LTR84_009463 [Exophiala bonariae]